MVLPGVLPPLILGSGVSWCHLPGEKTLKAPHLTQNKYQRLCTLSPMLASCQPSRAPSNVQISSHMQQTGYFPWLTISMAHHLSSFNSLLKDCLHLPQPLQTLLFPQLLHPDSTQYDLLFCIVFFSLECKLHEGKNFWRSWKLLNPQCSEPDTE